jgi:hypothetical protein
VGTGTGQQASRARQGRRSYLREHACGLVALLLRLPRRHAAGRRRVRVLGGLGVHVHVLAVADGHPGGHARDQRRRGGAVHFGLDARVRVRLREALRLGVVRGAQERGVRVDGRVVRRAPVRRGHGRERDVLAGLRELRGLYAGSAR